MESNWQTATTFEQNLIPKPSRQKEELEVQGIIGGKDYYFSVRAVDDAGNISEISNVVKISIPLDETPPTITGVSAKDITDTEATVVWQTDESATSQVEYGTDTSYGSLSNLYDDYTKEHSVRITGLKPNTVYHYRVISTDKNGNKATSKDYTFKTSDFTPPVISDIQVSNIQSMQVTITWKTDEPSTSKIIYGKSETNLDESTEIDTNLVTDHSVAIMSLDPNTDYYFKVESKDANGNTALSKIQTFYTPPFGGKAEVWGENEISDHKNTAIDTYLTGDQMQWYNFEKEGRIITHADLDRIGLIYFDLSDIPKGSVIARATLKLYLNIWVYETRVNLYYVTDPDNKGMWSRNGVCYYYRDNTKKIEWANGIKNPHKVEGELAASTVIPYAMEKGWIEWDVTEAVRKWVNGEVENQGLFIKPMSNYANFYSSDYEDASLRPILEINYTPPSAASLGKPGKPIHVDD